jgi:hypothetical protein
MLAGPRLRQVAVADCGATAGQLKMTFGWPEPFHDPGVSRFGLTNAVLAAGDTFIEVVAPIRPGTTAGRYLQRRGGDSGYMAIFQMPDLAAARRRAADAGVRVAWTAGLAGIAGTHTCIRKTFLARSCRWTGQTRRDRGAGPGLSGPGALRGPAGQLGARSWRWLFQAAPASPPAFPSRRRGCGGPPA